MDINYEKLQKEYSNLSLTTPEKIKALEKSITDKNIEIQKTITDLKELKSRIVGRGTDEMPVIEQRMTKAIEEIDLMRYYDYAVENDKVENAVRKIKQIIESEHLKVSRVIERYKKMIEEL